MAPNPKVNFYFSKAEKWQKELEQMRKIALDCELTEELKWGCPCYTHEKHNIVLIHAFKEYCAFLFFKGALLKDPKGILVQQTENVQAARQIRFTSLNEISKLKAALKNYIYQAAEIEEAGLKVELKKTKEFKVPEEFQKIMDKNGVFRKAFEALTPGRQRGYLLYFSAPKQSKTRASRVEQSTQNIISGKGLND